MGNDHHFDGYLEIELKQEVEPSIRPNSLPTLRNTLSILDFEEKRMDKERETGLFIIL